MSGWSDRVLKRLAESGVRDEFDHRIAVALGECVLAYADNEPSQSVSGQAYGLGRRKGRQDLAVAVVGILLGVSKPEAEVLIQKYLAEKIEVSP